MIVGRSVAKSGYVQTKRGSALWHSASSTLLGDVRKPETRHCIMDALLNDPTTNKGWKFCGNMLGCIDSEVVEPQNFTRLSNVGVHFFALSFIGRAGSGVKRG